MEHAQRRVRWKTENFPDPKKFIDEMHAQHYKVVLHIVIEGQRMSGAVADPCTPDRRCRADARLTIVAADRAVPCYWPYHKPLYDLGVDGMWPDQGDGLDEPSRMARIRMYWEGPQQYRPNERPFALHRNGTPGMQRYGAFLWSGDVYSFWETLKTHVPVAINTGLSGIPFWGTDIGGFVPTADYTGELHVRWLQFGTFCPSFRSHGRNWHLRLPWGWNMGKIGPSEPARLHRRRGGSRSEGIEQSAGRADREEVSRAALPAAAPYTYTIARECCDTGCR
jgi:alpha-glucosidase/alpha-D-xyloside xylohydrolase